MRALAYAATRTPDREAGRFAVTFPDPPGVISQRRRSFGPTRTSGLCGPPCLLRVLCGQVVRSSLRANSPLHLYGVLYRHQDLPAKDCRRSFQRSDSRTVARVQQPANAEPG
jgi:hypothetical protein